MIGISGIPASGKTTFAHLLVQHLNIESPIAICIGLDGWHIPRSKLTPEGVRYRGADWTFDSNSYTSFLKSLLDDKVNAVYAPSFHHEKKDPVENDIPIEPSHKIIVIEGLYVFLGTDEWKEAAGLLDERWLIEASTCTPSF